MMNVERPARKTGIATPLALVFALATMLGGGFLGWKWQDRRWQPRLAAATAQASAERDALRQEAEGWATAVAERSGRSVIRGFLAGVHPALLAERHESLEMSAVALLRLDGIVGIHVLRPDGGVIYSSDAKYATAGQVDERAAWALVTEELAERQGTAPGTLELAAPVIQGGRILARVWLIYRPDRIRDAVRPAAFAEPPPGA